MERRWEHLVQYFRHVRRSLDYERCNLFEFLEFYTIEFDVRDSNGVGTITSFYLDGTMRLT
jgi:hypothetical protein